MAETRQKGKTNLALSLVFFAIALGLFALLIFLIVGIGEAAFGIIFGIIISGISLVVFAILGIVFLLLYLQPVKAIVDSGAETVASAVTKIRDSLRPKNYYCEYCGGIIERRARVCKACGSRNIRRES